MNGKSGHGLLVGKLLLLAVGMFGFGYLLVPIYDVFCEITGLGGRTGDQATVVQMEPDLDRTVTVEFVASVNQGAPWDFRPSVSRMEIHPGEMYQTSFFARNESEEFLVGHAVPSVAPGQAARYLQKTECFCFNAQDFEAGESKDMPVIFFVDPELPEHVDTVTLSYTFFARDRIATAGPGDSATMK
jgi:cytochrome c oxidase assembly protein subunit 11